MDTPSLTLDQFLTAAKRLADIALQAYTRGDSEMVLMHAAISVENLSKALLFAMNPTFLVELHTKQFDALLHLTGHAEKATKLRTPRTIGAKEALARVRQLVTIKTPKDPLDQIIEIRDGAVHTGAFGPASTRELLTIAVRYANEIYDALEDLQVGCDERWGKHAGLVATLVEDALSEIQHEVHRKVTAARDSFQELMDKIPESEQPTVAAARRATLPQLGHLAFDFAGDGFSMGVPLNCPACTHPGALCIGDLDIPNEEIHRATPRDTKAAVSFPPRSLRPTSLMCGVCGLSLEGEDEVKAAGFPERLEIDASLWRYLY